MRAFLRYASLVAFVVLINGALPAQTVAILDSANTRNYFGAHYPACNAAQGSFYLGADEYQRYFRGWQYVLEHDMGMTPAILGDGDVSEGVLARYRVLVLSN